MLDETQMPDNSLDQQVIDAEVGGVENLTMEQLEKDVANIPARKAHIEELLQNPALSQEKRAVYNKQLETIANYLASKQEKTA